MITETDPLDKTGRMEGPEDYDIMRRGIGQTNKKWWQKNLFILCLFIVTAALIYGNSRHNIFQYDDHLYVVANRNIRTLENVPRFFTNPRLIASNPYQAGHYRPLVVLSYALNYAAGDLNPVGYHLVNIAIHAGSAFVIYLIVKAMLGGRLEVRRQKQEARQEARNGDVECFAALTAGLIFLVHPFNSEAVNYITARSSLMSGFFYLLAFYCWVRYRSQKLEVRSQKLEVRSQKSEVRSKIGEDRRGFSNFLHLTSNFLPLASCPLPLTSYFYLFSLLAFVAGMLSKEVAITLPLVLFLYDLYFPLTLNTQHSTLRTLLHWRTYIPYLPFVLIVGIPYLLVRLFSYGSVLPRFNRDMMTQIQTEFPVLVKHWQMFFFPYPLTLVHDVEIYKTIWSFPVIWSALILIVYIFIAILLSRISFYPWRVVSFFLIWFFIVLLPTTIFPLNAIFQENRGYLAIVSFAITAGIIIEEVARVKSRKIAIIGLTILIIVYSTVVIQRNSIWKDDLTLWKDAVEKAPRSVVAYTSLAYAYGKVGMFDRSIEATRRALVLGGQEYFYIHDNLARIYLAQSKWGIAAREFEIAIGINPNISATHNELGTLYYRTEKLDLAEKEYLEAIRLDPADYMPYFNLGVLYETQGKVKEAIEAYRKSLSLFPNHIKSHFRLGLLLEEQGEKMAASEHYRQVLHLAGKSDDTMVKEAGSHLGRIGK